MLRKLGYIAAIALLGALPATDAGAVPFGLNQLYAVGFFSWHQPTGDCNCTGSLNATTVTPPASNTDSSTPSDPDSTFTYFAPDNPPVTDDKTTKDGDTFTPPPPDNDDTDITTLVDNDPAPPEQEVASVPEPATLAILGAGILGFGAMRRRRARKA